MCVHTREVMDTHRMFLPAFYIVCNRDDEFLDFLSDLKFWDLYKNGNDLCHGCSAKPPKMWEVFTRAIVNVGPLLLHRWWNTEAPNPYLDPFHSSSLMFKVTVKKHLDRTDEKISRSQWYTSHRCKTLFTFPWSWEQCWSQGWKLSIGWRRFFRTILPFHWIKEHFVYRCK